MFFGRNDTGTKHCNDVKHAPGSVKACIERLLNNNYTTSSTVPGWNRMAKLVYRLTEQLKSKTLNEMSDSLFAPNQIHHFCLRIETD